MESNGFLKYFKIDKVLDSLTGYLDTRIQLLKVEIKEETSEFLARFLVSFALIVLIFCGVLFLSIAAALYIGSLLGSPFFGFLIVGSIYLILCILLYLLKDKLKLDERIFNQLRKEKKETK